MSTPASPLRFRDVATGRGLATRLRALRERLPPDPLSIMHVCGSHEQAIARFGLRGMLPEGLEVRMGPGCPVCITAEPEVDEGVALARAGVRVATYGDMLRVPGRHGSLADARSEGASVDVVYGVTEAIELATRHAEEVVFFATGFETTAVTTAAAVLGPLPPNFSVLCAHKYIPPAMDVVAAMPHTRIAGYLAAGHAATITGYGVFEPFVARHRVPVVVAGFEPLDILAALVAVLEQLVDGRAQVVNAFPRCVTRDGNLAAQKILWQALELDDGDWRGVAHVPHGNLRLKPSLRHVDARQRFPAQLSPFDAPAPDPNAAACRCGEIMTGLCGPTDCALFGAPCRPEAPVGACMVSSEGACRIWATYGGRPDLGPARAKQSSEA